MLSNSPEPGAGSKVLPPLWGLSTLWRSVPRMPTTSGAGSPQVRPTWPGTESWPLLSSVIAELRTWAEQGRARLCDTSPPPRALPREEKSPESRSPRCCCPSQAKPEGRQGEQTAYQLTGLEKAWPGRRGRLITRHPLPWRGVETRSQAPHSVDYSLPKESPLHAESRTIRKG